MSPRLKASYKVKVMMYEIQLLKEIANSAYDEKMRNATYYMDGVIENTKALRKEQAYLETVYKECLESVKQKEEECRRLRTKHSLDYNGNFC